MTGKMSLGDKFLFSALKKLACHPQLGTVDERVLLCQEACCPNGTERGCPTRSSLDCRMSARNSTGFGVVERAAAETAALRRLQNDLGNTPQGYGGHRPSLGTSKRRFRAKDGAR